MCYKGLKQGQNGLIGHFYCNFAFPEKPQKEKWYKTHHATTASTHQSKEFEER